MAPAGALLSDRGPRSRSAPACRSPPARAPSCRPSAWARKRRARQSAVWLIRDDLGDRLNAAAHHQMHLAEASAPANRPVGELVYLMRALPLPQRARVREIGENFVHRACDIDGQAEPDHDDPSEPTLPGCPNAREAVLKQLRYGESPLNLSCHSAAWASSILNGLRMRTLLGRKYP